MKILLVGIQGSGKSTQGKLLAEKLKVPYISTGDIFRKMATKDTQEGRTIRKILASGNLIDDRATSSIVRRRLQEDDTQAGFVVDGYPRNLNQVKIFDPGFDLVVYLSLTDTEAVERLMRRGREDDTKELIEQRIKLYMEQTEPMLEHYESIGLLKKIDARFDIKDIENKIWEAMNGRSQN